MINYAWNNYYTIKAIKFGKLVTGITNLEINIQKHRDETRDDSYVMTLLHVLYSGRNGDERRLKKLLALRYDHHALWTWFQTKLTIGTVRTIICILIHISLRKILNMLKGHSSLLHFPWSSYMQSGQNELTAIVHIYTSPFLSQINPEQPMLKSLLYDQTTQFLTLEMVLFI